MDKINSLPDPILSYILSMLPIRFSVATSVLARRWRFLWTYNDHLFFYGGENYGPVAENKIGFSDMVYRVLLQHNGPINSLDIFSLDDTSQHQIDAWIRTAIAGNIQFLSISVRSDVRLPQCCFNCKTLVELSLSNLKISCDSGVVCLPRLKKLVLQCNRYDNDESLPNLVSGCSAIEELIIYRLYSCDGMICCYVRSPTLKSLKLDFQITCSLLDHEHMLVLDIPAVQYLQIEDNFSQIIRAEKLSSLLVAKVHFYKYLEANISRQRNTFQLVEKLSHAKNLTFASTAMTKILDPTFSIAAMRFHNLTKLEVTADWHFLAEVLESAYKLECLIVQQVFPVPLRKEVEDEPKCWREPKNLPKCLSSSLKYVSVLGFAGLEQELNMVKYIMRHATVLKRVHLDSISQINGEEAFSKLDMLQQISFFPCGSQDCEIALV